MFSLAHASVFLLFSIASGSPGPAPAPPKSIQKEQQISSGVNQNAQPNHAATQHPTTPVITTSPPTSSDGNKGRTHPSNPPSPDWVARFTAALAAIAFLQFCVFVLQFWVMRRQAGYMRKGLLISIRVARASKRAAEAAKKSVDAFVNSERAWIEGEIRSIEKGNHWTGPGHTKIKFGNYGRIPAIIEEVIIALKPITLEEGPEYDLTDGILQANMRNIIVAPQIPVQKNYDVRGDLISKSDVALSVEIRYRDAHHPALYSRSLYRCKKRQLDEAIYVERENWTDENPNT